MKKSGIALLSLVVLAVSACASTGEKSANTGSSAEARAVALQQSANASQARQAAGYDRARRNNYVERRSNSSGYSGPQTP